MRLKAVRQSCLSLLIFRSAHGWSAAPSMMSQSMQKSPSQSSARNAAAGAKEITFVRHGVTEMNEFLGSKPYGSAGFEDPGFFDTKLTSRGMAQVLPIRVDGLHGAAWGGLRAKGPATFQGHVSWPK